MKGVCIALVTLFLILPLPALAADYLSVETRISSDDAVHSAITISIEDPDGGEITVPIFGTVKNLKYDANFEGISCVFVEKPYGRDAVCDVSSLKRSGSFKIEFDSDKMVESSGGGFALKQQVGAPLDLARMSLKVVLPDGTALAKDTPYMPFDASNYTDGRNIFVYWSRENVVSGEVFTAQVSYVKFSQDQGLLIAGIFAFVALAAIGAMVFRRKFSMNMVLPVLRPDEKIVMERIMQHKSGVNQKLVVQESGYSKAKVSKVLKSLEERGVLKLERIGRSNKIFLESNLQKKEKKDGGNNKKA
jgi:hypothetical protein